jgi:hypothetical protein
MSDNPGDLLPSQPASQPSISLSMWAFLVLAPIALLSAARRSRRPIRQPSVLVAPRSRCLRLPPACCAVVAIVVLVTHVTLPHPDGPDFEGLRALRFFTVWCFAGVAVYFVATAAHCIKAWEEVIFYTVAPPSLLTMLVFWLIIFPSLPPRRQAHAFRVDEISMHGLSVPALVADALLCAPLEARAGRAPGLWLRPVAFTASYLPFHWAWLAMDGRPVYAFLRPSIPWAGAIHAALLVLVLLCFHALRLLMLARSWCVASQGLGPGTELISETARTQTGSS